MNRTNYMVKQTMTVYEKHGYQDRIEYLTALAEEYDMHVEDVLMIADTLGENEDFDGLISALEDWTYMHTGELF